MKKLTIATLAVAVSAGIAMCGGASAAPTNPAPVLSSADGVLVQAKMSRMEMKKMRMKKTKNMKKM
jgi:hypothetical protein